MGAGVSIIMIAVGAVLRFATTVHTSNFNVHTVGVILIVVGIVGLLLSLFFWTTPSGFSQRRRSRTVISDGNGSVVEERRDTTI